MKILFAILTIVFGGVFTFASILFGALMLTSANGPTRANWIAHYVLVYAIPAAIILICIFILIRLFK